MTTFLLKAFQRWTHVEWLTELFKLFIFIILSDKIVILLIFLVRVINTLGLSQVESIGLLLWLLDVGQRHRLFIITNRTVVFERVGPNLKSRWNQDSLADFGVIVTPVTFESYTGLIPFFHQSSRRIWLIEVAQNWWVKFFAPLIFLVYWRLLLNGIIMIFILLWWHEILMSLLPNGREDPGVFNQWDILRMPPRLFQNFLGVGQDRWHILIWTGKSGLFDQLLFDGRPWCNRILIIRFWQPLVQ